jgi:hypothetical protein
VVSSSFEFAVVLLRQLLVALVFDMDMYPKTNCNMFPTRGLISTRAVKYSVKNIQRARTPVAFGIFFQDSMRFLFPS